MVLGVVVLLTFKGSLQLLTSSHLRERDKCCEESFYVEEFGTDSFLVRPRRIMFPVASVGKKGGDGHLFWECSFPSLPPPARSGAS